MKVSERPCRLDVTQRLQRIIFIEIKPDLSSLSGAERLALKHCIAAAKLMTDIYLRQVSPELPQRRAELYDPSNDQYEATRKYFDVNGGPWDVFHNDEPFLPQFGPKAKGISLYPEDLSIAEWRRYLEQHPDKSEQLQSNYTVINRVGQDLIPVPYSETYGEFLLPAAKELKAAADLLPEGTLKRYLVLQADAFLTDRYFDSNVAWVETNGIPFELTIGPHEVYEDRFLGLKGTFESIVGLRDEILTKQIHHLSAMTPEIDARLADQFGYRRKGSSNSALVIQDVYRGGEAAFGRQFIAYNLPNDRAIQEQKGSKKVFSRTLMKAKFLHLLTPIAQTIFGPGYLQHHRFEAWFLSIVGHELAHGIGPGAVRSNPTLRLPLVFRELYSPLEEAKAGALGFSLLKYFIDKGVIRSEDILGCLTTQLSQFVNEWRSSYTGAHSVAALIQYNWLVAQRSLRFERASGRMEIDPEAVIPAMEELSRDLISIQYAGSYENAKAFVDLWGRGSEDTETMIERLSHLPYEVFPVYRV
jgi:hypothetical protein